MAEAAVERAGRGVRERMAKDRRELLRIYGPYLVAIDLALVLAAVGVVAVSRALDADEFQQGLVVGVFGMLCVGFPLYVLAMHGWFNRSMGGEAEVQTADDLRERLDRTAWWVLDDLLFGSANVDHVVVGPGRVFVVETKWVSYGTRVDLLLERAVGQARWGAERVRLFLRSEGVHRPVTPVVVIRGPRHQVAGQDFVERDGVLVATSRGMDELVTCMRQLAPRFELDAEAIQSLRSFSQRQDAWLARQPV